MSHSVCASCAALWRAGFKACPKCGGDLRVFGSDPSDAGHPAARLFHGRMFTTEAPVVVNVDLGPDPVAVTASGRPRRRSHSQ